MTGERGKVALMSIFQQLEQNLDTLHAKRRFGTVKEISGLVVSCEGLEETAIGDRLIIEAKNNRRMPAEIVGFRDNRTLIMPYGTLEGIGPGCRVYDTGHPPEVMVSNGLIGRVLNGLGEPVDDKGALPPGGLPMPLRAAAPNASKRQLVNTPLDVGVRVLNTFLTTCKGQRMGIFSGSGVGKSVLMSMVARYTAADVIVIGLIGERGREVREFLEQQLGTEGLKKAVVVVATGDESPLMRRQAAYTTMAIAEFFRSEGKQVMLLMDSVTRFAVAQREIGLSAGEPPATRGYTPSVFAELPRLLERAGPGLEGEGAITAFFTVLVEGSDMDEPIADAVRGILDGHIVLSRQLAERGHFPAVDVLRSISRMVPQCHSTNQRPPVQRARGILSTYDDMAELIRLGAYRKGGDPKVDEAVLLYPKLESFLQQDMHERSDIAHSFALLEDALKATHAIKKVTDESANAS